MQPRTTVQSALSLKKGTSPTTSCNRNLLPAKERSRLRKFSSLLGADNTFALVGTTRAERQPESRGSS